MKVTKFGPVTLSYDENGMFRKRYQLFPVNENYMCPETVDEAIKIVERTTGRKYTQRLDRRAVSSISFTLTCDYLAEEAKAFFIKKALGQKPFIFVRPS